MSVAVWYLLPFAAVGVLTTLHALRAFARRSGDSHVGVSGVYGTYDPEANPNVRAGVAIVKQRGSRICVRVEREISRSNTPQSPRRVFVYRGIYQADKIALTFADRRLKHRIGTLIVHREGTNDFFSGLAVFYEGDNLVTHRFQLRKDGSLTGGAVLRWRVGTALWLWGGLG